MPSVIIVQGSSSAYLYVQECRLRGLTPVVVNPPEVSPERVSFNIRTGGSLKTIDAKTMEEYPAALEEVKKLDPVCVVAGNSGGVIIADMMARDLGFKGNDPDTTWRRDSKNGMQQSLKEAGVRYIRTKALGTEKDLDDFWKEVEPKKVMMKFDNGAGSVGNKICYTIDEAKEYLTVMKGSGNIFGKSDTVLVQEYIEGEEYIVDTVSCDGEHLVTDIWKYEKILTKYGELIYDEMNLITDITTEIDELVEYAYKALDATGFRYGPCHSEFKIDDKGPVLIETNARPIGASMTAEYLDEFLGHHITDIALDAFLDPSAFRSRIGKPYRPKKYAMMKIPYALEEGELNNHLLRRIFQNMKSFRSSSINSDDITKHVARTIDLETAVAGIKLCHEDIRVMRGERDLLDRLQKECPDLLFNNKQIPGKEVKMDIGGIIGRYPMDRNILVVTEHEEYVSRSGKKTDVSDNMEKYEVLIYADASEASVTERFESIMQSASMLADGGYAVIADEVIENLPYKNAGIELILNACGCDVEPAEEKGMTIGRKRS